MGRQQLRDPMRINTERRSGSVFTYDNAFS